MGYLNHFLSAFLKLIFESGEYTLYHLDSSEQYPDSYDPDIKVYLKYREIPKFIRGKVLIHPFINSLYYRIKSHQATFLCFLSDSEIIAYGWIQSWKPFKRKFRWLFEDGTMLGPYWTNPKFRGQGYYGRLLKHSIALVNKKSPIIIYTIPENLSSQKGIEKAGFKKIGTYSIYLFFRFFQRHKEIS